MKSMIAAVALILTAGPVMAQNSFVSSIRDGFEIDFLSWCDGNNVMAQTQEGKNYVRFNCADEGKVCKVYDAYRMNRVIYSANCEKAK